MKVSVDTYGCTRNKADEELIKAQIKKSKHLQETTIPESDTVILNTCGVKNKTQSKMINRLKTYREQGKKVLIAGCLPKINKELLMNREAPLVGPKSIEKIPKALEQLKNGETPIYTNGETKNKLKMKTHPKKGITGIIPISEGCIGNCSYCGVKNARGTLHSYPEETIIKKIKQLSKQGKKQIYITGQDTGCYGIDQGKNLTPLLNKITNIKKDIMIRVGMMNPEHLKEEKRRKKLIKAMKDPKIYSFLHIPVQSGSNKVLKDMNRRYKTEEFKEIAEHMQKEINELNLATDIIVGYPTETQKDLNKTINLIKDLEPDIVNISRFYPRPNTKAQDLNPLPSEELKKRSKKLTKITKKISEKRNKQYIGKELDTLITGQKGKRKIARAMNYKKIHLTNQENTPIGEKTKARITDYNSRGLMAKVIN